MIQSWKWFLEFSWSFISLIVSFFWAFTRTLALSFLLTACKSGLKFYYHVAEWKIPLPGLLVRPHKKPEDVLSHRRAKSQPRIWAGSPLWPQISVTAHKDLSKNHPAFPLFCLTVSLVWPKLQTKPHLLLSISSSPLAFTLFWWFLSSYHQSLAVPGTLWASTGHYKHISHSDQWHFPRNRKLLHGEPKR